MSEEFNPFITTDGGIDQFTGEIVGGVFEVDDKYDRLKLVLQTRVLDAELVEQGITERKVYLSVGEKWHTHDGGETATHESGRPTHFSTSSAMGNLHNRLFAGRTHRAGQDDEREVNFDLAGYWQEHNLSPFVASAYVGWTFVFETDYIEFEIDGETIKSTPTVPVELVSYPDGTELELPGPEDSEPEPEPKKQKKAPAKKSSAKKKAAKKQTPKMSVEELFFVNEDDPYEGPGPVHAFIQGLGEDDTFDGAYAEGIAEVLDSAGYGSDKDVFAVAMDEKSGPWSYYVE